MIPVFQTISYGHTNPLLSVSTVNGTRFTHLTIAYMLRKLNPRLDILSRVGVLEGLAVKKLKIKFNETHARDSFEATLGT